MICARVQAHPSRNDLHEGLVDALAPLPVEVMVHESTPPDPWAGYLRCLTDPPDCTHLLIVQDDVQPCRNFVPAVERVAEAHPSTPVCLFLGALPSSTANLARQASIKDRRYVSLTVGSFVPLVAVLWPIRKAQEFLEWGTHNKTTRADDGNAAKWARRTKQQIMVTVPSLVQHNDFIPSVKGGRDHVFGQESWRQAILLAADGLDYNW